mgnify:CR=1 FL=1
MPILENVGCVYSFSLDDGSFETGEHIFDNGICFNCGAKERINNSLSANETVINNTLEGGVLNVQEQQNN